MIKKSYAILGLGKFGASIAEEMSKAGVDVLAVDIDEDSVHSVSDFVTVAVRADVCDTETMKSLGLSNMDAAIVAITGNLDASIMATITAKEAGIPVVVAKAKDEIHAKILEKVGADRIIVPEKESGIRMARCLMSGNFIDFIELSDKISMVELNVRPEWIGKSLRELKLREKARINVIAVHTEQEVTVNMNPDMPLKAGYSMWVTVDKRDIDKLA